jgi:hypothetical protein
MSFGCVLFDGRQDSACSSRAGLRPASSENLGYREIVIPLKRDHRAVL